MNAESFAAPLAENVRNLRRAAGLTQARLAAKAKVPRATLSLLESGAGNPTLSVVLSVCQALGVRLEEVLAPEPSDTVVHRKADLPQKQRGRCVVRKALPQSLGGVELEELIIPGGETLVGTPHTVGTREYLLVQSGKIELHVAGVRYLVAEGDVASFRGHQKHSYHNPGRREAHAVSVIAHAIAS